MDNPIQPKPPAPPGPNPPHDPDIPTEQSRDEVQNPNQSEEALKAHAEPGRQMRIIQFPTLQL